MQFGRVLTGGREQWVVVRDGEVIPLDGPPWASLEPRPTAKPIDPAWATWLPPTQPSKIVCVGRNYAAHAKERRAEVPSKPMLFLEPPSSLLASGGDVVIPPETTRAEFEGELAFIVGRRVRRFRTDEDLGSAIAGWLCADDVSARDLQKSDGQW